MMIHLLSEADSIVAKTPKNIGRIAKHKNAVKKRLKGEEPTEETTSEETPSNPLSKSLGKIAKHRHAIRGRLKQDKPEEDTTGQEPEVDPLEDAPVDEEPETDEDITGQDELDAVDDEVDKQLDKEEEIETEEDNRAKSRLMSIDKVKINKALKEITLEPAPAIPINKIKEILQKYELKMVDDTGRETTPKLIGVDGNTDVELAYNDGRVIANSALVMYWHQLDRSEAFEFHFYLS